MRSSWKLASPVLIVLIGLVLPSFGAACVAPPDTDEVTDEAAVDDEVARAAAPGEEKTGAALEAQTGCGCGCSDGRCSMGGCGGRGCAGCNCGCGGGATHGVSPSAGNHGCSGHGCRVRRHGPRALGRF